MTADLAVDAVDALTADGGIVTVQPGDRDGLTRLYDKASEESLRLRFFAAPSSASLAAEVDRLCAPESDGHVAMLAAEGDELVGVASCGSPHRGGRRAEFAVFVADGHCGRGIGTLLLEHLAARTQAHQAGYLEHTRVGRRNRYTVNPTGRFRHPAEADRRIGDLLSLFTPAPPLEADQGRP